MTLMPKVPEVLSSEIMATVLPVPSLIPSSLSINPDEAPEIWFSDVVGTRQPEKPNPLSVLQNDGVMPQPKKGILFWTRNWPPCASTGLIIGTTAKALSCWTTF